MNLTVVIQQRHPGVRLTSFLAIQDYLRASMNVMSVMVIVIVRMEVMKLIVATSTELDATHKRNFNATRQTTVYHVGGCVMEIETVEMDLMSDLVVTLLQHFRLYLQEHALPESFAAQRACASTGECCVMGDETVFSQEMMKKVPHVALIPIG